MEKPLETPWVGLQVGWGRVSENHQGGVNSVSQVHGDPDMVFTYQLCWGGEGSEKEQ